ncbi:hydroxymethylbilane synthase [bacterium]|nr:hydroxymethylbilane synthase [bacterium]
MSESRLIIGSRGSKLALWQAGHVKARVEARHPGVSVEIRIIKTLGDKVLDVALSKVGGKGLFTKELESAILEGTVDCAVHSLKDMPTVIPEGLILGAITERECWEDALVSRAGLALEALPAGARLGTSSLRRRVQLERLRPDLEFADLRGNVDTRLARLDRGDYDAIVLARAGLTRLGLAGRITQVLGLDRMVPAAGQGALALQWRAGDSRTWGLLSFLADWSTTAEVSAERRFLHALGGGCQVPIGAKASLTADGQITLVGLLSDLGGKRLMRDTITAPAGSDPGLSLARRLLSLGGQAIVDEILAAGGVEPEEKA